MTEHRQLSELTQRRQVCNRIDELKSSCEHLLRTRDELSGRLSGLIKIVDQLVGEKGGKIIDPNLNFDTLSYHINSKSLRSSEYHQFEQPKMSTTRDLVKNNSSSRPTTKGVASDAFKIKLSQCLSEIGPKAEEALEISDKIMNSTFEDY